MIVLLTTVWFCLAPLVDDLSDAETPGEIDYFSIENMRLFCDYLYRNGDYSAAAGEFMRLHLSLDGSAKDTALFSAARSHMKAGSFQLATPLFDSFLTGDQTSAFYGDALLEKSRIAYLSQDYPSAADLLADVYLTGEAEVRRRIVLSISYARLNRWEAALEVACPESRSTAITGTEICAAIMGGSTLPKKSPFLASALSSIVPGLGKGYTGRWMDAVFSFFSIGTTAWLSYRGFSEHGSGSTKGWLFGILSGVMYIGNVYGSSVSAGIHNHEIRTNYFRDVDREFDLSAP